MPFDVDNLEPGPDLESIDFTKLDKGDNLEEPKAEEPKAEEPKAEEQPKEEPKAEEQPKEEPKAEEQPKEEQPRDDKSGKFKKKEVPDHIPKQRFDEAVGKEREAREAAEKRAADLERQLRTREAEEQQAKERTEQVKELDDQVSDLEKQHAKQLLDGEGDKAAETMKEIRQLNRQIARLEAQEESTAVVSQQLEKQRLDATVAKWEAQYPELNPRSEVYDTDLIEMILPMQHTMVAEGVPPSQALDRAVEKVMGRMQRKAAQEDSSDKDEQAEAEGLAKAKQEEEAKQKAEERSKNAVEKALETQSRQPAQMQSQGFDSDKAGEKGLPDVSQMSAEEFAALPEATRARLRGDLV